MAVAAAVAAAATAAARLNNEVNALFAQLLCFPVPTVAALNGHWCAAGGMLGLCFDFRVMHADRGYFFVPAVDLGIVYSGFQVELMKSALPRHMHRSVICYNGKRWSARELAEAGVVDVAAEGGRANVLEQALVLAKALEPKGRGPARRALGPIKQKVHARLLAMLEEGEASSAMGFSGRCVGDNYAPPPTPSRL